MRHPLLERRHRARGRLSLARRDGNEDDVLARATHAAIGRARAEDDLERMSTAVSNAGSLMDALAAERDDIAAGVATGGTGDAEAYVYVAQRRGACAVEVQDATVAVDKSREEFEKHRVENGAQLIGTYAGKTTKTMTVDGPTLQVLREQWRVQSEEYRDRGYVPKDDDGTAETQNRKVRARRETKLAYVRKRNSRARKGIDRATLLADVVPVYRADRGQLFAVDSNVEAPPGEERTLWATQEEAHNQATRWRKILGRPWHAVRAAKEASGGAKDVFPVCAGSDLYNVKVTASRKLRSVRLPGTSSWEYDRDTAVKIRDAFYEARKAKIDKDWYVPKGMMKKATKAKRQANAAKTNASRKKAKP